MGLIEVSMTPAGEINDHYVNAFRHFVISAKAGHEPSLKNVKAMARNFKVSLEEIEKACNAANERVNNDKREAPGGAV